MHLATSIPRSRPACRQPCERRRLAEVTPADVAAWLGRLTDSGLSAASVRYAHRVLSLALAYAVLDGRLARNPAEGVPLPRVKAEPKRFLTHGEVERLAGECGRYSSLIYVLGYTGLRWGEVAALQVADLDLMRRRITVARAMAEVGGRGRRPSSASRRITSAATCRCPRSSRRARRTSRPARTRCPRVPVAGGGFLRNGNFRRNVFDDAAERAGLARVTPHALRHTAASLAIAAGATVVLVQRMLGHCSPSVTLNVYCHLFADDLDTVANRLNAEDRQSGGPMGTPGLVTAFRDDLQ